MKKVGMQLQCEDISNACAESEIWNALLRLDSADILELGCGTAELTRQIASSGVDCRVTAMEVDKIQHAKNLQVTDLPNVRFVSGAAEDIPVEDDSFDIVLMFKSLHHVPQDQVNVAMNEIRRVLKPGGLAYISEPIFAGDFNEILRLFHDEEKVRKAAFEAVKGAVEGGSFTLVDEVFFLSRVHFMGFAEFEEQVIAASHSQHHLSEAIYELVRQRFNMVMTANGAHFLMPMRVDLLEVIK